MNRYSAYAAILVATIYAALVILQYYASGGDLRSFWDWATYAVGFPATIFLVAAVALLLVGAARVLRNQSGGLRLLCGAWGLSLGISGPDAISPITFFLVEGERRPFATAEIAAWASVTITCVMSIAGLAMTVLHKERKS